MRHTERKNGSRSAPFFLEDPMSVRHRAHEICVPSACRPGSSSDCDARMPWMVPSGASKAPAASRATSEQLARPARLLLATLRPLWPPGWTAPGRSLGAQRVGAACSMLHRDCVRALCGVCSSNMAADRWPTSIPCHGTSLVQRRPVCYALVSHGAAACVK